MIELTIRNEHSGITFTEKLPADRVEARIEWYADRSITYPPGWTVTRQLDLTPAETYGVPTTVYGQSARYAD